jgi:uncharacterized protein YukE
MPKVDADPDELRRFASALRKFKTDADRQLNSLNSQVQRMKGSDPQQQRFASDWERTSRSMRSFLAEIDRHAPYLDKKARQLEDYLK